MRVFFGMVGGMLVAASVAVITLDLVAPEWLAPLRAFRSGEMLAEKPPIEPVRPVAANALRVLFLGDHFSTDHDMSAMIAELASAAETERPFHGVCHAARDLKSQLDDQQLDDLLVQGNWDFVVIQERCQNMGLPDSSREKYTIPFAKQLASKVESAGSKLVIFMPPGLRGGDREYFHLDQYPSMQRRIYRNCVELAEGLKADLAPVGTAWYRAYGRNSKLGLWDDKGERPSTKGAYLIACLFFAKFYGTSPVGNKYTAGLKPAEAKFLQQFAADYANNFDPP